MHPDISFILLFHHVNHVRSRVSTDRPNLICIVSECWSNMDTKNKFFCISSHRLNNMLTTVQSLLVTGKDKENIKKTHDFVKSFLASTQTWCILVDPNQIFRVEGAIIWIFSFRENVLLRVRLSQNLDSTCLWKSPIEVSAAVPWDYRAWVLFSSGCGILQEFYFQSLTWWQALRISMLTSPLTNDCVCSWRSHRDIGIKLMLLHDQLKAPCRTFKIKLWKTIKVRSYVALSPHWR